MNLRSAFQTKFVASRQVSGAVRADVDAGDFSLTVARDAMDSIAICPESVRSEELV